MLPFSNVSNHCTCERHPMETGERRISEVTRRAIFDRIALGKLPWCGRLPEDDFLSRLYNLDHLPTTDDRRDFSTAQMDIWQHRVRNRDWDDDWVFYDQRFDLLHCVDDAFLLFLCETLHPVVQSDHEVVDRLLEIYNSALSNDGFQLIETTRISGLPVYAARELVVAMPALEAVKSLGQTLTADYLNQQITRMVTAVHTDPELAIGTAKELIETCCKTIMRERGGAASESWELPKLVHETLRSLGLTRAQVPETIEAGEAIRRTLGNLAELAQGAAHLRNLYGTGHGKDASTPSPAPHHARLAVGAASTFAVFLFDIHQPDVVER